jgi:hypothetical protein
VSASTSVTRVELCCGVLVHVEHGVNCDGTGAWKVRSALAGEPRVAVCAQTEGEALRSAHMQVLCAERQETMASDALYVHDIYGRVSPGDCTIIRGHRRAERSGTVAWCATAGDFAVFSSSLDECVRAIVRHAARG